MRGTPGHYPQDPQQRSALPTARSPHVVAKLQPRDAAADHSGSFLKGRGLAGPTPQTRLLKGMLHAKVPREAPNAALLAWRNGMHFYSEVIPSVFNGDRLLGKRA